MLPGGALGKAHRARRPANAEASNRSASESGPARQRGHDRSRLGRAIERSKLFAHRHAQEGLEIAAAVRIELKLAGWRRDGYDAAPYDHVDSSASGPRESEAASGSESEVRTSAGIDDPLEALSNLALLAGHQGPSWVLPTRKRQNVNGQQGGLALIVRRPGISVKPRA